MAWWGFWSAVVVATFSVWLAWYLNQSTPDVRYSLSERIPVSFANTDEKEGDKKSPEVVQQLEVRNIGNLKAENVLVKISGDIKAHLLNPFSAADNPKVTAQPRSFQLEYPSLPPGASFQLSFKSIGDGIGSRDVSVSDNRGKAREALSSASISWATYISWTVILVYFVLIGLSLRSSALNLSKSSLSSKPMEGVVSTHRPFYRSKNSWSEGVIEVIQERLRNAYLLGADLSKHAAYQFLQLDRPEAISDAIGWKTCTELAIDRLKKTYREAITTAWQTTETLKLLQTEKPMHFPETTWLELVMKANERYVELRKNEFVPREEILQRLHETKPASIDPGCWEKLTKHWEQYYVDEQMGLPVWDAKPLPLLRQTKPAYLSANFWHTLTQHWERQYFDQLMEGLWKASDVTAFVDGVEKSVLTEAHKAVVENRLQNIRSRQLADARAASLEMLLSDLLANRPLPGEKPPSLQEHNWLHLRQKEQELQRYRADAAAGEENSKKAGQLTARERELVAKQEKVERQLQFINDALNDPTAVDRVEDYNTTFAKGNLDNLRKVAQTIAKRKKE